MNNYKTNMFEVPLLHLQVLDWESKKKKLISMMNDLKFEERSNKLITDFHLQNNNTNFKYNHEIGNIFFEELSLFAEYFEFGSIELTSSWFEVSNKNSHHTTHNHGATGYSSVCFVDYDSNVHSPTKFISPFNNFIDGQVISFSPDDVQEGSLLFFPSLIHHYTLPNNSEIPRKILSFNIKV
jgi:hypothetical protein